MRAMTEVDAHWHDADQIIYASKGVLAVHSDTSRWITPAHRALWVPAGFVHAHRAYGTTRLHLVGLTAGSNLLKLRQPTVLAVTPLLRELIVAYTDLGDRRTHPEGIRIMSVLLDQVHATDEIPVVVPSPSDPRLVALCGILEADPCDNRSLETLGRVVGSSSRTLARLFRQDLAMTFPQWRTQLRLYHALRLLAEDHSVKSVARRCGFANSSVFIDVFHRCLGYSPGAYARTNALGRNQG